jgi:hypothetical protein
MTLQVLTEGEALSVGLPLLLESWERLKAAPPPSSHNNPLFFKMTSSILVGIWQAENRISIVLSVKIFISGPILQKIGSSFFNPFPLSNGVLPITAPSIG